MEEDIVVLLHGMVREAQLREPLDKVEGKGEVGPPSHQLPQAQEGEEGRPLQDQGGVKDTITPWERKAIYSK